MKLGSSLLLNSHVYAYYVITHHNRTNPAGGHSVHVLALCEYVKEGIKTTIPFHLQLMQDERFRSGDFNTKFLDGFVLK